MVRMRVGIVRYGSVARAIADAFAIDPTPECKIGRGRITLTFRQAGASLWSEEQRLEYALYVAQTARSLLGGDLRKRVRRRANRAIVVVFEDHVLDRGCDVESRWQCVVPRAADTPR